MHPYEQGGAQPPTRNAPHDIGPNRLTNHQYRGGLGAAAGASGDPQSTSPSRRSDPNTNNASGSGGGGGGGVVSLVPELQRLSELDFDCARRTPRVLILVGLQGSGKSTFVRYLQQAAAMLDSSSHASREWVRVSQDVLGSRQKCEYICARTLAAGSHVIVDRCNFNERQREPWVQLAKARGAIVGALVFCVSVEECIRRVQARTDHETLEGGPHVEGIIRRVSEDFRPPQRREGLHFCRYIRTAEERERVIRELIDSN